jgi:D-alanyl-D-alanine carboxypeptidase/D-alanyl-D-alanine-endopeptidase (penicillin-binding protein 4)
MLRRFADRTRPLTALLTLLAAAAAASADGLSAEVAELVRRNPLPGATVAVSIWDPDSQLESVAINGDQPMIPASNMKLLTTGAALDVLGPDFEFRTVLLRDGARLIVRGDGDPAFGDPELLAIMMRGDKRGIDVRTLLSFWVQAVVDSGITSLSEVVVDDRIFDRELLHPGWPADQLNRAYCPEVAGLNFHLNIVHFFPRPSRGARPLLGSPTPDYPGLEIRNRATSRTGQNDKSSAWVARPRNSNGLSFHGNVRFEYKVPVAVTIHDPPALFAALLARELRRAGITVGASRVAEAGERLDGPIVGPVITTPIGTVLARCNEDSENLYAEALLKRVGHEVTGQPGSWGNGKAALRHVVHERLREPRFTEGLIVSDGSGLSRENRVSASTLARWLASFHDDERLEALFVDGLARGGTEGTLRKRFRDESALSGAVVHAKSGYINYVSCLSGFVTSPLGARRSFSILVNDLRQPGSVGRAKRLQEQIVAAIAKHLTQPGITMGSD